MITASTLNLFLASSLTLLKVEYGPQLPAHYETFLKGIIQIFLLVVILTTILGIFGRGLDTLILIFNLYVSAGIFCYLFPNSELTGYFMALPGMKEFYEFGSQVIKDHF